MSYLCGCYYHEASTDYYMRMTKHYLPLIDSESYSTIFSTTSRTVLKQTFTNPSSTDAIKECIYTFPLYDGVSIVAFTCRIGSKVLTGLVKEKAKAKEIFDEAVAKGETAGLLEQALEASDVFSTKLGNVPAGKRVIVEISYIGELKHHETDGVRFTIPTSIAPRYGSGPLAAVNNGYLPLEDNGGIKITVDVSMPEGSFIKGVQSPSHPIAVSMGTVSTAGESDPSMSNASATLSLGSTALEKDFVLIVQVKDIGMPKAVLESHPTIKNHRALMATLVPKFSLPPSRPEIVFVADRSGSMKGNIPMLVSAMKVFLKSMPVEVKFNICSFGSSATFLWPRSKSYTQETLLESTSHVGTFGANMGGTEIFQAIKATVERRYNDLPLEIVLLTDGDIWQQQGLFTYVGEQVAKAKGSIRIFPLGIGNGVSHSLIEGLARAGNGFAQSVQQGERLDNCVVRMLRGALSPHITDYTLEVKYDQDDDDFELVEKVTDGMKILLSPGKETIKSAELKPEKQATISLFDPSVGPEKDDIQKLPDLDLPVIPYPKLLQSPHQIPSLFPFSRSVVYLLLSPETIQRNPRSVVLRATSIHGPLALEIPVEMLSTPAETIHQLAAKRAVQDLEEGRGWIFDAKDQDGMLVKDRFSSRFEDLVKKEAVRLGEKYQIAGKWCSFVAVSANDGEITTKRKRDVEAVVDHCELVSSSFMSAPSAFMPCMTTAGGSQYRFAQTTGGALYSIPQCGSIQSSFFGFGQLDSMQMQSHQQQQALQQARLEPQQARLQPKQVQQQSQQLSARKTAASARFRPRNPQLAPMQTTPSAPSFGPMDGRRYSLSVPPVVADWKTKSATEKVLALVFLQAFEGSWPGDNQDVADVMGFEIPASPKGERKAWVTAVVIYFLELKMGSEKGTWELVVEKARAWLVGYVRAGLQDLENEAREFVERN